MIERFLQTVLMTVTLPSSAPPQAGLDPEYAEAWREEAIRWFAEQNGAWKAHLRSANLRP